MKKNRIFSAVAIAAVYFGLYREYTLFEKTISLEKRAWTIQYGDASGKKLAISVTHHNGGTLNLVTLCGDDEFGKWQALDKYSYLPALSMDTIQGSNTRPAVRIPTDCGDLHIIVENDDFFGGEFKRKIGESQFAIKISSVGFL